jgi:hypothetical protein
MIEKTDCHNRKNSIYTFVISNNDSRIFVLQTGGLNFMSGRKKKQTGKSGKGRKESDNLDSLMDNPDGDEVFYQELDADHHCDRNMAVRRLLEIRREEKELRKMIGDYEDW